MKVFFVGIHNKPGKGPLDSSTVSGKRIDQIIEGLKYYGPECIKTNLFNNERLPSDSFEVRLGNADWNRRYSPSKGDVVVLLGREVKHYFSVTGDFDKVELYHPARVMNNKLLTEYIKGAIRSIEVNYLPF